MRVNPVSQSAAATAAEFEMLVLKKSQGIAKAVAQSLVEMVKSVPEPAAAPAPQPRRIDTYA